MRAKRVKSGMFSASVAQKPTMAVSDGQNVGQNWPAFLPPSTNCDGASSSGPKPPAFWYTQPSSTKQIAIFSGAVYVSSLRIAFMPCTMNQNWIAQNARKQISWAPLMPRPSSFAPPISWPASTPSKV